MAMTIESDIPAYFQTPRDDGTHAQVLELFESVHLKRSTLDPEQSLCLAILFDAMQCATRKGDGRIKNLRDEAVEWIKKSGSRWVFSFDSICEILGIEPTSARKAILAKPLEEARYGKSGEEWHTIRTGTYDRAEPR